MPDPFDWQEFGKAVRRGLFADGRGDRAIAAAIGVTETDLSRARWGKPISAGKVMAICDFLGTPERIFFKNNHLQSMPRETGERECPAGS